MKVIRIALVTCVATGVAACGDAPQGAGDGDLTETPLPAQTPMGPREDAYDAAIDGDSGGVVKPGEGLIDTDRDGIPDPAEADLPRA